MNLKGTLWIFKIDDQFELQKEYFSPIIVSIAQFRHFTCSCSQFMQSHLATLLLLKMTLPRNFEKVEKMSLKLTESPEFKKLPGHRPDKDNFR